MLAVDKLFSVCCSVQDEYQDHLLHSDGSPLAPHALRAFLARLDLAARETQALRETLPSFTAFMLDRAGEIVTTIRQAMKEQTEALRRQQIVELEEAYFARLTRFFDLQSVRSDGNCMFASVGIADVFASRLEAQEAAMIGTLDDAQAEMAMETLAHASERCHLSPVQLAHEYRARAIVLMRDTENCPPSVRQLIVDEFDEALDRVGVGKPADPTQMAMAEEFMMLCVDKTPQVAVDCYTAAMSRQGMYGTLVELEALSYALQRPIHLFYREESEDSHGADVASWDPMHHEQQDANGACAPKPARVFGEQFQRRPVQLAFYMAKRHYDALLSPEKVVVDSVVDPVIDPSVDPVVDPSVDPVVDPVADVLRAARVADAGAAGDEPGSFDDHPQHQQPLDATPEDRDSNEGVPVHTAPEIVHVQDSHSSNEAPEPVLRSDSHGSGALQQADDRLISVDQAAVAAVAAAAVASAPLMSVVPLSSPSHQALTSSPPSSSSFSDIANRADSLADPGEGVDSTRAPSKPVGHALHDHHDQTMAAMPMSPLLVVASSSSSPSSSWPDHAITELVSAPSTAMLVDVESLSDSDGPGAVTSTSPSAHSESTWTVLSSSSSSTLSALQSAVRSASSSFRPSATSSPMTSTSADSVLSTGDASVVASPELMLIAHQRVLSTDPSPAAALAVALARYPDVSGAAARAAARAGASHAGADDAGARVQRAGIERVDSSSAMDTSD